MRISYAIQPNVPVVNGVYAGGGPARRTTRGGYNRQSGGRGFRGGNRRRNDPRPRPTEAELDAEMDSYMSVPVSVIVFAGILITDVSHEPVIAE